MAPFPFFTVFGIILMMGMTIATAIYCVNYTCWVDNMKHRKADLIEAQIKQDQNNIRHYKARLEAGVVLQPELPFYCWPIRAAWRKFRRSNKKVS